MNRRFLIWSFEHQSWWGPRFNGYVESRDDAGFYTLEEALQICHDANFWMGKGGAMEAIVPVEEMWKSS